MKPMAECLYYLVREDFNADKCSQVLSLERDEYFNDALENIRALGLENISMCTVEVKSLINAAKRRGRLEELDRAVEEGSQ